MGQGRGVVRAVRVVARAYGHRLRRVPVGGGEAQARLVEREIGSRGAAEGHRHRARRPRRELHRVADAPLLRHFQRSRRQDEGQRVVVLHGHGKVLRHRAVAAARGDMGQGRGVVRAVRVVARAYGHRLLRVPVGGGEGQAGPVEREIGPRGAAEGHRHRARRPRRELHRIAGVPGFRHLERRRRQHETGFVVVGHPHLQVLGYCAVAAARGGVRQRRGVVCAVRVVARAYGHRLRRVPVGDGEAQARLVQREVRPRGAAEGHRHRARRARRELHRVVDIARLRHLERRRRQHETGFVVVGHPHSQVLGYCAVAAARGGVRQRRRVVRAVRVVGRAYGHRLRRVPVGDGEAQARLAQREIGPCGAAERHRHRAGRPRRELHRVGRIGVLGDPEGRHGEHEVRFVVVDHRHRKAFRDAAVAAARRDMRQRRGVVRSVIVGACAYGHRLRRVPVGDGEAQARLVQREVRPCGAAERHRHRARRARRELHRVAFLKG